MTGKDTIWVNLTPHEIVVRLDSGANHRIPPCGEILRVDTRSAQVAVSPSGIRINEVRPSNAAIGDAVERVRTHLSDETAMVIVSGIALDWMYQMLGERERYRVVAPDTSPGSAIREPSGRIVAVRALRIGS